jgi:hypothetical protein
MVGQAPKLAEALRMIILFLEETWVPPRNHQREPWRRLIKMANNIDR